MADKVRGGRGVDDRDVAAKTLRKGVREADRRGAPTKADRLGREQQRRARGQL